ALGLGQGHSCRPNNVRPNATGVKGNRWAGRTGRDRMASDGRDSSLRRRARAVNLNLFLAAVWLTLGIGILMLPENAPVTDPDKPPRRWRVGAVSSGAPAAAQEQGRSAAPVTARRRRPPEPQIARSP